jgi:hypothetical protein
MISAACSIDTDFPVKQTRLNPNQIAIELPATSHIPWLKILKNVVFCSLPNCFFVLLRCRLKTVGLGSEIIPSGRIYNRKEG